MEADVAKARDAEQTGGTRAEKAEARRTDGSEAGLYLGCSMKPLEGLKQKRSCQLPQREQVKGKREWSRETREESLGGRGERTRVSKLGS